MEGITTVILAGGQGRRMGGVDKVTLLLNGRPLLNHLLIRLQQQKGRPIGAVALNANGDPQRFSQFNLPILPDQVTENVGPLAGVAVAMTWAVKMGKHRVLTLPCDLPLLPDDLLFRLASVDAPIVAASSHGRSHPLVALWSVELLPKLQEFLDLKQRRVMSFVNSYGVVWQDWDGMPDPFTNLNYSDDLSWLEEHVRHGA